MNKLFKIALLTGVFTFSMASSFSQQVFAADKEDTVAILPETGKGKIPNPLPSGTLGNPATPLSSQKMPLSTQKINEQIQKVITDSNERLKDVNIGNGDMPDVHEDIGTLKSEIETAKILRKMDFEKQKVDSAIKLWKSTYDGKREEIKENGQQNNNGMNNNGGIGIAIANNVDNNAIANQQAEAARKQQELEDEKAKELEKKKKHAEFILEKRKLAASVEPVISSIYGQTNKLNAIILIPYIGSKVISNNSSYQYIDGSVGKVLKIGDDSVTISHNGRKSDLVFGNSVPSRAELLTLLKDDPKNDSDSNGDKKAQMLRTINR